jgi:hypothetical protein
MSVNDKKARSKNNATSFATGTLYIEKRRKLVRKPKIIMKL